MDFQVGLWSTIFFLLITRDKMKRIKLFKKNCFHLQNNEKRRTHRDENKRNPNTYDPRNQPRGFRHRCGTARASQWIVRPSEWNSSPKNNKNFPNGSVIWTVRSNELVCFVQRHGTRSILDFIHIRIDGARIAMEFS